MEFNKVYTVEAGVKETKIGPATITSTNEQLAAQAQLTYIPPSDFKVKTTNTILIHFSLKEALNDLGISAAKFNSYISAVKMFNGRIKFTFEGENFTLFAIELPPLPVKIVRLEGGGEGSFCELKDNTLLVGVNFASPAIVYIDLETTASIITGFTASLIMVSLVISLATSIIKTIRRK